MAGAAMAPLLLTVWAAGPAQAHGAPTYPVSRVYACSPDGGSAAGTAACKAAVAANGGPFTFWDNIRVPNVNGRDRQLIPDGKLCSGGLSDYKGLDLARSDFPSTRLTPGAKLTMTYASTIAHTGTFKLYLTKAGYDPSKPLTWSELPTQPFAEVKDPPLTGGAYRIKATLPTGRTGRQLIYTIWQNSSTEDTYYSCSDVVFPGGTTPSSKSTAGTAGSKDKTASPSPSTSKSPAAASTSASATASAAAQKASPAEETTAPGSSPVASDVNASSGGPSAPMVAGGAAAVLVLTGGAALALRLRRR
ncbi:lytic polysaccharide monooxygenase [Streptomyces sp. MBT62]|uniref:lytic polysaccharide monooxygenase auxiliary activity family 9 protein n=1 Tax=Streptomyces sp. MBT62 TaxID=2800410 RepID=UPI001F3C6431|nr:lytic polysaccharide monooxygenase [Streptomyces sp. MBT62]